MLYSTMELPPRYREFIEPFIAVARGHLEAGRRLAPFAFVASFAKDTGVPVPIDTRDDEGKNRSAAAIRKAAAELDADCIFSIMEAWGLPSALKSQYDEIVERYGSITDCPFRIDAVNFVLETRHGVWTGQALVEPRGSDGKQRTFGEVALQYVEGGGGFATLLPGREAHPPDSAPLH